MTNPSSLISNLILSKKRLITTLLLRIRYMYTIILFLLTKVTTPLTPPYPPLATPLTERCKAILHRAFNPAGGAYKGNPVVSAAGRYYHNIHIYFVSGALHRYKSYRVTIVTSAYLARYVTLGSPT